MPPQDDITIFPITAWDVRTIASEGVIIFRPHFVASPMQKLEEAIPSRYYGLTPKQALALIDVLRRSIKDLERAGFQPSTDPKH